MDRNCFLICLLDIAYIGALNPDHYHITKLFLENGKHVLCEKPLCLNHKQVQSLVNISKQKKLFLMEAIWSRFSPVYLALEKEIQAGKLGEIKHVEANFGAPIATVDRLRYLLCWLLKKITATTSFKKLPFDFTVSNNQDFLFSISQKERTWR